MRSSARRQCGRHRLRLLRLGPEHRDDQLVANGDGSISRCPEPDRVDGRRRRQLDPAGQQRPLAGRDVGDDNALQLVNNSKIDGPIDRQHDRRRQQRDSGRLPDDHQVPAGMPGNNDGLRADAAAAAVLAAKEGAPRPIRPGERRRGRLRARPGPGARELPQRRRRPRAAAALDRPPAVGLHGLRRADRLVRQRAGLSWAVLRGRCRSCKARIPWVYPAVELATALLVAGCVLAFGVTWTRSSPRSSAPCSS